MEKIDKLHKSKEKNYKQVIKSYLNHELIRAIIAFVIFITISSTSVSGEASYHKVTWLLLSLLLLTYHLDRWTDVSHKTLENSELLNKEGGGDE